MKFIILLLLSFTVLIPYRVFASDTTQSSTLSVSPAILPITLTPGKTLEYRLTVRNLTAAALPVQASIESFDSTDEEGGYTPALAQSPLARWAHISQTDMIIDANDSREIRVTVDVPIQVNVGGYYAIIFLTPVTMISDKESPHIVAKIGIPMLATLGVDETVHTANIATFTLAPRVTKSSPLSFLARVKNNGLSHFSAKPFIKFKPLFGNNVQTVELAEKVILPGKIRRWEQSISPKLGFNWYTVSLDVSLEAGQWIHEQVPLVIAPVWEIVISTGSIIILIFFLSYRRNLKKAWRALFK